MASSLPKSPSKISTVKMPRLPSTKEKLSWSISGLPHELPHFPRRKNREKGSGLDQLRGVHQGHRVPAIKGGRGLKPRDSSDEFLSVAGGYSLLAFFRFAKLFFP